MSKLAVAIAVPALAASIGLGVLCLDLSSQVDELKDALEDQRAETAAVVEQAEKAQSPSRARTGSRREDAIVRAMEDRLQALESRTAAAPGTPVAASSEPGAALASMEDLPDVLRTPDFDRAVRGVLDARDAERRAERMAKAAEKRAEQLLRGLEVDDQIRGQVQALVSDAMARRVDLRDAELEREVAREQAALLRDELTRSLESVLTADQMEAVRPRLDDRRALDRRKRTDKDAKKADKRRRKREKGADLGS